MDSANSYFSELSLIASDILKTMPAPRDPQPISYVEGELARVIDDRRREFERSIPAVRGGRKVGVGGVVGLNTIGMLSDRLTILSIKKWTLEFKRNDVQAAADLKNNQIAEIVAALDGAAPGYSSLNTKVTSIQGQRSIETFAAAFVGLLTTNLQLWEAQEVLYLKNINELPAEEIRAYVGFFSKGNVQRNICIEATDGFYWKEVA